ncbi:CinA family protein [Neisseria sp.]|uniref:CinA family protein n=1 Tax=Neisseria sp. TaxID=192066 RepID=UPI0035A1B7B5
MNPLLPRIAAILTERGQTVSCAESCTGGLLAAAFTSLSGSSRWFHQSWVTYSNEAKRRLLGVDNATLVRHGAVSRETVREMAAGALKHSGAHVALSISGIAGPDGGTPEKPVGTVWFGLCAPDFHTEQTALFHGDREAVRKQAVDFALEMLTDYLQNGC